MLKVLQMRCKEEGEIFSEKTSIEYDIEYFDKSVGGK